MQIFIPYQTRGLKCGKHKGARNFWMKLSFLFLLAGTIALSGCSSSGSPQQVPINLSGNWQFTVAAPGDQSFQGGLQGGFLMQQGNNLTGGAVYAVSLPGQSGGNATVCNSGSATISGTLNGQNVNLTAVAGTQTFTFTGTLNLASSTMVGTYTSTAGTASDGSPCGTAQTGLDWSALLVPPIGGAFQGSFHSTGGTSGLNNQNFPVTASFLQGPNVGASNSTLTGSLSFIDPTTQLSIYPCFDQANLNGQISGTSVTLQIIGLDGSNLGQIGGSVNTALGTVTFDSTALGYILHSATGTAYAVSSKACPGGGTLATPGDAGNICLSASTTACQEPVLISPGFLLFPTQVLGAPATTQSITITNNDPQNIVLNGLQLQWSLSNGVFGGLSDFNGLPNFSETDNCASSVGDTFSLNPGQSCTVKISFTPQESCPWIPYGNPPSQFGAPPASCPDALTAFLTVNSPMSADNDTTFSIAVTGYGASALEPSTGELDFGAQAPTQSSLPQILSFTNHGSSSVQILAAAPCLNNPPANGHTTLPRPLEIGSPVAGLQVVGNGTGSVGGSISPAVSTIFYSCDSDPTTQLPNFQISADTCTGATISPQASCSLNISYVPQPGTSQNAGLDFFLELNTVQCANGVSTSCEIDSGRFPVELKSNAPSPLRMSPTAGLDFGVQALTHASAKQTIMLFNDPADPNTATVNFIGKVSVKGDYSESDDCPASLAPGQSCTLTIGFRPQIIGYDPGSITINYSPEPTGIPQIINLRGTGELGGIPPMQKKRK